MISDEDLEVATDQGIVSPAQAAALRDLAARRHVPPSGLLAHEERFRFMRGFNDFFFAIGIVLLCAGMAYFAGTMSFLRNARSIHVPELIPASPSLSIAIANLVAAALVWALAELLVRRMRLVLPGILLALFFVFFSYMAIPFELLVGLPGAGSPDNWNAVLARASQSATSIVIFKALVAATAAALFYERFRLPFALMLIAGALVIIATATLQFFYPNSNTVILAAVLLVCGLAVFAAAMRFDISDRERLTRRADCAFWLHLLAAPLIVHSLVSFVTPGHLNIAGNTAVMIFGIVLVLAVVSIAIDRRALFVSALTYLGVVIAYAVTHAAALPDGYRTGEAQTFAFFVTLLILGAVVVALGVGWMPLRRGLIALLPAALANRFPSVPVRS